MTHLRGAECGRPPMNRLAGQGRGRHHMVHQADLVKDLQPTLLQGLGVEGLQITRHQGEIEAGPGQGGHLLRKTRLGGTNMRRIVESHRLVELQCQPSTAACRRGLDLDHHRGELKFPGRTRRLCDP